jgi:OFA family oxalate/formate antiporter-like MFS transporter
VPIWGNISIYITSYLRASDKTVTMESTYVVFPITILMTAIFMQLGSYMIEKGVNPRLQTALGGICLVLPLILCSFTKSFGLFVTFYSVFIGLAFGLLYMPALKNSWQYFPSKKGLISGLILSCYSIGAILWTIITKTVANPSNERPQEILQIGDKKEYFYDENSDVVKNVPQMLRILAYIYLAMVTVSMILINKRGGNDSD